MLIKAIQNNKNLTFHDLKSGVSKKIGDFYLQSYLFDEIKKSLVVLYLDNSLESIEIYLKFLNSKHAIALLNKNLEASLKQDIEESYLPQFIYDVVRDEIQGYSRIKEMSGIFRKNEISNAIINPSIKVLLSTSGTTGSPKFVKLSEDNIYQNALSIVDYLPINSKDKCPLNLPIYYFLWTFSIEF